ncbi:MAG: cytidine deaminase [Dermabacter sp.]|nr:cytidine deaminase [Dermabacter sp.]
MSSSNISSGAGEVGEEFAPLLADARDMTVRAYAPYSGFPVGAAARADDGRIVRGCNVENAGYGVTLCAECGLVSELVATGGGTLTHFVCVNGDGEVIMPCGRCRQLLAEHAADDFTILTPLGPRTLEEILPQSFGASDLTTHRSARD